MKLVAARPHKRAHSQNRLHSRRNFSKIVASIFLKVRSYIGLVWTYILLKKLSSLGPGAGAAADFVKIFHLVFVRISMFVRAVRRRLSSRTSGRKRLLKANVLAVG